MFYMVIDLGGTKAAFAILDEKGFIHHSMKKLLDGKEGDAVSDLLCDGMDEMTAVSGMENIQAISIAVPGLIRKEEKTVWAPNIGGWENHPLEQRIAERFPDIPVFVESDRTCYILGETWMGAARGYSDAIYIGVGTGIGAGILAGGRVLAGPNELGGAIGWMAVPHPLKRDGSVCNLETYASGSGMPKLAAGLMRQNTGYSGVLKDRTEITATDLIELYESDAIAAEVIRYCISVWGMAIANLVSIFNPQKIIMGGGVFGPALQFLPQIAEHARHTAQPLSVDLYSLEASALGQNAGLFGAGCVARNYEL